VQDGTIKCSYSTCAAETYETGFSWQVSTVESSASDPTIFMQGSTVYCAYVKSGNLYLKISKDNGAIWGTAEKMNDVDGKVIATPGSIDVGKGGIVFSDNRNGKSHIYFAPIIPAEPEIPTINGPVEGDANTAYDYTFATTDGQDDQVSYFIDWGR
jgi:hypothetical protein